MRNKAARFIRRKFDVYGFGHLPSWKTYDDDVVEVKKGESAFVLSRHGTSQSLS